MQEQDIMLLTDCMTINVCKIKSYIMMEDDGRRLDNFIMLIDSHKNKEEC